MLHSLYIPRCIFSLLISCEWKQQEILFSYHKARAILRENHENMLNVELFLSFLYDFECLAWNFQCQTNERNEYKPDNSSKFFQFLSDSRIVQTSFKTSWKLITWIKKVKIKYFKRWQYFIFKTHKDKSKSLKKRLN